MSSIKIPLHVACKLTLIVILKKEPSALSFGGPALVTYPRENTPGKFSNKYLPNVKLASMPNITPISIVSRLIYKLESYQRNRNII